MRKTYVVLGVAAIMLAGVVAFAVTQPKAVADLQKRFRATTVVSDKNEIAKRIVVYVRNPYKDDYGMSRVPGYVDNLQKTDIASVDLEIRLFDSAGDRKEVILYTVEDIEAGSRTTFDANAGPLGGSRTAEVRIKKVVMYR